VPDLALFFVRVCVAAILILSCDTQRGARQRRVHLLSLQVLDLRVLLALSKRANRAATQIAVWNSRQYLLRYPLQFLSFFYASHQSLDVYLVP
jgi:hypothetical protein